MKHNLHSCCDGISRRDALDYLAKGGLAMALSGVRVPAYADDVVRIGYLPITDATPLLVAYVKGFFRKYGLQAERPVLIRAWSNLVEGFSARKFNLVHLLKPIPIWMRYNNQVPVKIVAWAHTNGSAVVINGKSDIQSFADLGGTNIAVPYWYSIHNVILQKALRNAGLEPVIQPQNQALSNTQVNLQILPPPEMPTALASKKIDGYIVAEPFNALGEIRAGAKVLRFTGDIWKNHPCCVITMHQDDLEKRRAWSQKIVNALVDAEIYASKNKAEVARLLSRNGENFLPVPRKVVERAMLHYQVKEYRDSGAVRHGSQWGNGRIDFQPYPYPSATKFLVNAMNDTLVEGDTTFLNSLDAQFVADDLVDYQLVKNALSAHKGWIEGSGATSNSPFVRKETFIL